MSDKKYDASGHDRDENSIERLLKLAGNSQPIPPEVESRVYENVRREWVASTDRPESSHVYRNVRREWIKAYSGSRPRRWLVPAALAASFVLAIILVPRLTPEVAPPVAVGTIVKIVGIPGARYHPGDPIYPGAIIETTRSSGITIELAAAESLRIDENTELVVKDGRRFRLASGRIYADTGDFTLRNKGLAIDTVLGTVVDVGTQFSVHVMPESLDVAVRDGRVDVTKDGGEIVAVAGERILLERGRAPEVVPVQPHDAYWDWASALAPTYDLEGRTLLDFLRWAARETGRELVFETNELRLAAMRTDLHGVVADVELADAIGAVLATTRFKYRVERDRIVIVAH